jgi:two-component system, chemotaxis family, sensor kinase CheA
MSIPDQQDTFAAGFMEDYFAEAEEHIISVRRSLLALEAAVGFDLPPSILEDLFRSFHSLKGISAMVELRAAELVAHSMESCLRAVIKGELTLTNVNFELLVDGAKALESVILAHRAGTPLPDVAPFLDQLEDFRRGAVGSAAQGAGPQQAASAEAASPTARTWKATFTPSAELVARGVKVDTIRSRLMQIGQVLSVAPRVISSGGIAFEFVVETEDAEQLAAWREDGLTHEPLAPGATANLEIHDTDQRPVQRQPVEPAVTAVTNFVRVDLARLDELMRLVGDMVVTRARLEDTLQRVERHVPFHEWRALQEHNSGIERQLRDLREGVMRVRLVPIGEIFRRMPFVVRDLARDSGKRVRLDLVGQATEIDKFLIERMMDPVLHLVRNAISHAIETPESRVAAGKSSEGVIRLSASTAGESVVLEVADDGRGIDVDAVVERARAGGIALPDGPIDSRGVLEILCASGFSTRDEADRGSGRGVGMAVVRNTVQELGGTLAMETQIGRGTTFRVTLPLTLAITDAIIAHVGDHTFAVPQSSIREVIEVDAAALRRMEGNELYIYRGGTLPMVRLAELFSIAVDVSPRLHAIVLGAGPAAVGLLVDRIGGQREIVVKTITDPLIRVDGVTGATELGDGRLVLILDVAALSRTLRVRSPKTERVAA